MTMACKIQIYESCCHMILSVNPDLNHDLDPDLDPRLQHCNQSGHITKLSDTLNLIFTVLFTVEMILKLLAFKAKVSAAEGLKVIGHATAAV